MNIALIIILLVILIILAWALFSTDDLKVEREKQEQPRSDILLRRRASDKEIEENYPEERKFTRRATDPPESAPRTEVDEEFKLPYPTDEIINENSRFRVYRRTLMNAEIYAKKSDFNTAVSLYEGVNARINDLETNHKIEANIEYLKKYREMLDTQRKEKLAEPVQPKQSRELRISLDGPLSIPDRIQIGLTAPAVQQPVVIDINGIADQITAKIRSEIAAGMEKESQASPVPLDDEAFDAYQAKLEELESAVEDLKTRERAQESISRPTIIEAKYESPIPVVLDPKPILDLLERLPAARARSDREAPVEDRPRPRPEPERREEAPRRTPRPERSEEPATVRPAEQTREDRTETLTRKEEDDEDDWLLKKDYDKDEASSVDELTDEDIFAKILEDDSAKKKQDYEILGDSKEKEESSYDVDDRAFTIRQQEDERFYEKFLKNTRRKARELPVLKVSYDFSKLPDEFSLAREKNILEYSYYKYKPMLDRASEFIRRRKVKDAINYYKVVMSQNIPPEFRSMIRKNIGDLTEYLEKFLSTD
ncbi:MAG: hypothetical protein EPN93_05905 [Spirochaetes bacterium]|nr:MAG: hypothetical protein EPN93_05905 [Spirochaetota bacterium]